MARAMSRQIKVTPGVFQAVKICLESGNTAKETAQFMKLSHDVISFINQAETYDDYRAMMYAKCAKAKQMRAIKAKEAAAQQVAQASPAQVAPAQVSPAVVKVEAPMYMMQDLRDIKELLNGISNKLAGLYEIGERLADLWEK